LFCSLHPLLLFNLTCSNSSAGLFTYWGQESGGLLAHVRAKYQAPTKVDNNVYIFFMYFLYFVVTLLSPGEVNIKKPLLSYSIDGMYAAKIFGMHSDDGVS
jgi:hypothetical protein